MDGRVIVVGGGVAGMSCAITLKKAGIEPLIIERSSQLGGNAANWHKLFPTFDSRENIVDPIVNTVAKLGIRVLYNEEVERINPKGVMLKNGRNYYADTVVVCTGYELFDARRKEEYGYGIYKNVFTTADIERMFNQNCVQTAQGTAPKRVAFLHCVGSRDEKVGNSYCSKVCCITGVKQAIEIKQMYPDCEIFNFYMDIRMFGPGYEELYKKAQVEHNIHFIRGRISEASPTIDNRIQIKAEDTLVGRPLKMTVDMFVLIIGMQAGANNKDFALCRGLKQAPNRFMEPLDPFWNNTASGCSNIFYAGAVTAPKNIGDSINEGVAAAMKVIEKMSD